MINLTTKWLPSKTPLPACHGQRTPTNTTTTNQNHQTGLQATTIPRAQTLQTTTNQHQIQNQTQTKKFIQLRAANLPRRGRPILLKRQQNPSQNSQTLYPEPRHISLKNYEILNPESYALLLNQSQISNLNQASTPSQVLTPNSNSTPPSQASTPPSQISNHNQVQNQSQLLNRPLILNQNQTTQLLNQAHVLNSTSQIVDQSQLFYQKSTLENQQPQSLNQFQLRARKRLQANPPTREIIIQQSAEEQNQETTITPVYQIISVPFLARSILPTPSVKQRESKTNGLVKLKQIIVNANGKNGQKILVTQDQENISAHLNLSNQQQQPPSSNQLNITTERNLNTTPTNLNLITKTPTTTMSSYAMMGIQLPGDEFQDLNGALQIAAVEELMAPACLDDYFIETNNISDFDTTKGTYKLQELNEMTINQMNVNYAGQQLQLLPEDGQEQLLLKDIPGEENIYNILRMPHSEELVTLTQPTTTIGHETSLESDSLFTQYQLYNCDDSLSSDNQSASSYIEMAPVSPWPTESDCMATSELHNNKYIDDSIKDEDLAYRIEFSPPPSTEPTETPQHNSPVCNSSADEAALDIEQFFNQIDASSQNKNNNNLKRNSDHLVAQQTKIAKKPRMHIPMARLVTDAACEDVLSTKVPDTPEVCEMVDEWLTEDIDTSIHSYSSSPSWSGTSFAPPDYLPEAFALIEPKYENPPSIASSYICEEPSYATPSPSNSSGCTIYSTNPSSPAASNYGSVNGMSRKRRGRPPKQHSDMPNPEVLQNLPESERKRIEDRCKNNEASRQSRQKNKEKQMILLAEEEREQQRNEELKNRMRTLEKQHLKLKAALYRKFNSV